MSMNMSSKSGSENVLNLSMLFKVNIKVTDDHQVITCEMNICSNGRWWSVYI